MSESEHPSKWPIDLLYQHIMRIIDERDRQYTERFRSSQEAIEKAEVATRLRFDSVNEFRALVEAMIAELMKREEALARFQQASDRADQDRQRNNEQITAIHAQLTERIESMNTQYAGRIEAITSRLDRTEGGRAGISAGWGVFVASVGAVAAIIAIIYTLSK